MRIKLTNQPVMTRLHIRVSLVLIGWALALAVTFLGRRYAPAQSLFRRLESVFWPAFYIYLVLGGAVLIHAALFGTDEELFRFSRYRTDWLFSFKTNVMLVRMAVMGFGLAMLLLGALGISSLVE